MKTMNHHPCSPYITLSLSMSLSGQGQFSFQYQRRAMPKKSSNYHTIALISHASKVMLKILQARPQWYVNKELPDVQAGFTSWQRDQRSNCQHPLGYRKRKQVPEKNIYFCFIDNSKAFDCVYHNKLWKILKEMGIPDHLICFL